MDFDVDEVLGYHFGKHLCNPPPAHSTRWMMQQKSFTAPRLHNVYYRSGDQNEWIRFLFKLFNPFFFFFRFGACGIDGVRVQRWSQVSMIQSFIHHAPPSTFPLPCTLLTLIHLPSLCSHYLAF